jgi:hypothetical protein
VQVPLFAASGAGIPPDFTASASIPELTIPGLSTTGDLLKVRDLFVDIRSEQGDLSMTLRGGLEALGFTFTTHGDLEIVDTGVYGNLLLTLGDGETFGSGLGFEADGTFHLQVNTTGVDQTLDGTPIPAGGRILVDGELIFDNGFSLEGAFGLTITGGAQPTLLVTATDAVLDLRGWASLTANGFLQIDATGIAAQLTLTTATGTGDVSFGDDVSLSASLFLQVNTTGDTVEINPPAGGALTVPGGSSYARVRADGSLVFFDGFDLDGTFDLTVSGSGLHVAADAELDVLDVKFTTNSELTIVDAGVYGNLLLTLGDGETFGSGLGFEADGTFHLQVNTTGVDQTLDGTPIPAGGRILVDGELIFDNGFSLEGAFGLTITGGAQPTLLVTATDAVLDLRGWASLTANGFLQIDSTGIAAQLTLATATGTGDVSFGDDVSLSASLFLQVNTTGDTVEINPPAGGALTVPGGSSYARVRADGSLVFFDDFDLDGTFDLTVSGSGLHVAADAGFDVLDFKFTTNSELTIVDTGVYGNLLLTLGVGETFGSGLGFKADGTFHLQVNTTGVDQTLDGTPIPAGGRILVDGELIFDNGFSLEGAFGLTITGGAQPTLLATATDAVLDLRGWASLTANGFLQIDATGIAAQLTLTTATGTGDVSFGDDVSLSASLFLQINTTGDTVEINPPAGTC